MTRTVERLTAEYDESRGGYGPDRDFVAARENEKPARLKELAMDLNVSL
jgi:hypothetical protein